MTVAKAPLKRVHKLLSDIDATRRSMVRGSFLNNDLSLLLDIHPKAQATSIKHGLNKAQTKAIANLNADRTYIV
jgi:hypothetical protein